MHAILRFIEGFRRGARRQREIEASKQRQLDRPSPPTKESPWLKVHTLLERLDDVDHLEIYVELQDYIAQGTIKEAEWKALEPELSREQDLQEFSRRKRKIQDAIREKLLSDFVRDVPAETYQRRNLKRHIETLLWKGEKDGLELYLTNVLELGLEKADKKQELDERPRGYAMYAWTVLVSAIKVAIVLGAFSVAKTRFEVVVVALLVLIYLAIESNFGDLFLMRFLSATDSRTMSKRVLRALREEVPEKIAEQDSKEEEALTKLTSRSIVVSAIQTVSGLIILVTALYELVFKAIL